MQSTVTFSVSIIPIRALWYRWRTTVWWRARSKTSAERGEAFGQCPHASELLPPRNVVRSRGGCTQKFPPMHPVFLLQRIPSRAGRWGRRRAEAEYSSEAVFRKLMGVYRLATELAGRDRGPACGSQSPPFRFTIRTTSHSSRGEAN